jgi:hypothetical protein
MSVLLNLTESSLFLSKAQCETIMRPFLNAGLSASGVVQSMPWAIMWGPLRYQGLDIKHLYTTQGVKHLLTLLRHATWPTLTGQLLRTSMEELQLELGVGKSFFRYSYQEYGSIETCCWMSATWKFLAVSSITLVDPFPKPVLASATDSFLMERFVAHGYRGTELRHLNLCRMHPNALRVSNICTSDGKHITDSGMEVQKDLHQPSSYTWPQTEQPEYKFRALWRTALAKVLTRDAESQALLIPLDCLFFKHLWLGCGRTLPASNDCLSRRMMDGHSFMLSQDKDTP